MIGVPLKNVRYLCRVAEFKWFCCNKVQTATDKKIGNFYFDIVEGIKETGYEITLTILLGSIKRRNEGLCRIGHKIYKNVNFHVRFLQVS